MQKSNLAETRRGILLGLVFLGLVTALILLPYQFRSAAVSQSSGNSNSGVTADRQILDYYDIRIDESKKASEAITSFRQTAGRNAVEVADIKESFVEGERKLQTRIPNLKVEYNKELQNPEVIGSDVLKGRAYLTPPTNGSRAETLRSFAKQNNELVGMSSRQVDDLKATADYRNPQGDLSFARLEQFVDGIPVFRGEIRAGFTKNGEMFRVVNNLAPGLEGASLSREFGDPAEAVRRAAGYINYQLKESETRRNEAASSDLKVVFGNGDWATTAEKMYFPIEPGVARAAWRVLTWEPGDAYYVIVDAETGAMLYRENITHDQTQAATYNVYANTNSLLRTMANPAPLTPNPLDPGLGTQGVLMPRTTVTFIGNEAPYTFNNNGWITDNTNGANGHTDGNNVEAGVDRVTPNGVDAPVVGTNRIFNFNYTPGAGPNNGPGDNPTTSPAYQNGAGTNLFYVTNRYHDETYLLGFTEQARNFQQDNFGRGGLGNDRVSAEAQDDTVGPSCSAQPCANNANFSTPADGSRGRMQMYIWNRMTPIRDGDLDAEIIVHELTHGLFGRLHNGNGGTQAGQMNEGNSDFFAHVMLSLDTDPINGVYVTGGYSTLNLRTAAPFSNTGNYYYGIRRFPKAVMAYTGGPNNRPHNPLTYADIDPAQMNLTNGAFAPAFTGSATAVHDGGEIWSSMLWEVRAKLVQRLGAAAGNRKALQLVMDGMKVSPSNPTMMQERNAILAAAVANGNNSDVADVWAGFAVRGLGFSATNPTGNTVTEGFDLPNAVVTTGFSVDDPAPGGDGDGYPEPTETVKLTVPVENNSGQTVNNVVVAVPGGNNANYGNISNGQTVVRTIDYTVPANAECGAMHSVELTLTSSVGTTSSTREFRLGAPVGGAPVSFANTTEMTIPTTAGPATPYTTSINVSGLTGTKIPKLELTGLTHTFPSDLDILLVGPNGQTFIAVSDVGGSDDVTNINVTLTDASTTIIPATLVTGEYLPRNIGANDPFVSPAPTGPYGNPPTAGTASFASVFGTNGANLNGEWKLYVVDDANTDGGSMAGWKLTFEANDYACNVAPSGSVRADFDGDGKSDLSVYRPSEGNWYLNRSTAGFTAVNFGNSSDKLAPGDFDGDGKTDIGVYRNGTWYNLNSSNNTFSASNFGTASDIVMAGDYDGDGKTDKAVFRPSDSTWYVSKSTGGLQVAIFGQNGDIPISGDFDGDGKTDYTVYRAGVWYTQKSTGGLAVTSFGLATDKAVPADYDGDGKDDVAVYRNGIWYILHSGNGQFVAISFGTSTDVPVPGDYDGDGKYDVAVYRGGIWYVNGSTSGLMVSNFGVGSDTAIPKSYIP